MTPHEERPAIGDPDPGDAQDDFADEHASTATDQETLTGDDGETESPRGWSGQESEKAP